MRGHAPVRLAHIACLTAFGDAAATHAALTEGRTALNPSPVLGEAGGEPAPLALCSPMADTIPSRWLPHLAAVDTAARSRDWGRRRTPVYLTSSNFGVDGLYTHTRTGAPEALRWGVIARCVEDLRRDYGWGANITSFRTPA